MGDTLAALSEARLRSAPLPRADVLAQAPGGADPVRAIPHGRTLGPTCVRLFAGRIRAGCVARGRRAVCAWLFPGRGRAGAPSSRLLAGTS